jgi:hypothetical protein
MTSWRTDEHQVQKDELAGSHLGSHTCFGHEACLINEGKQLLRITSYRLSGTTSELKRRGEHEWNYRVEDLWRAWRTGKRDHVDSESSESDDGGDEKSAPPRDSGEEKSAPR